MLTEISTYLATKNVGTVGVDIFLGLMPDKPDTCIALFEYAGSPPDLHWAGEYPGLQVRVRDTSYAAGRAKIRNVMELLHGLYEQVLSVTEEEENGNGNVVDGGEQSGESGPEEEPGDEEKEPAGTRYLLIRARGSPEVLKRDASDRVEFVVNFTIIKER